MPPIGQKSTETGLTDAGKMGSGITAAPRSRGQKFQGLFSFRGRFLTRHLGLCLRISLVPNTWPQYRQVLSFRDRPPP